LKKKKAKQQKEEPIQFKIETTVATPQMLKQLVGDNSPDEEEMDSTPQQQQMQKIEQQEATKPQAVVKVLSKNEPSII